MKVQPIKPELEAFVDDQVKAGNYASATEVVEAGISRLMIDSTGDSPDDDAWAAIDRAELEFDQGKGRSFTEFAAEFRSSRFANRIS